MRHAVDDKDGISAGRILAEMAALWKSGGETLLDALDEPRAQYGHFATRPVSLTDVDTRRVMSRLSAWCEPTRATAPTLTPPRVA